MPLHVLIHSHQYQRLVTQVGFLKEIFVISSTFLFIFILLIYLFIYIYSVFIFFIYFYSIARTSTHVRPTEETQWLVFEPDEETL